MMKSTKTAYLGAQSGLIDEYHSMNKLLWQALDRMSATLVDAE